MFYLSSKKKVNAFLNFVNRASVLASTPEIGPTHNGALDDRLSSHGFRQTFKPWISLWGARKLEKAIGVCIVSSMTIVAQQLDEKLATWRPETAAEVARMVSELIEWADSDALDLMSARRVEQEVLDLLDAD